MFEKVIYQTLWFKKREIELQKMMRVFLLAVMCLSYFISPVLFAQKGVTVIPEVNSRPQKNHFQPHNTHLQTTQFHREQIANSPVVDLTALLKQEQSIVRVTQNSGDGSQTSLSLRGFGDNAAANSLIVVDGFPLMNPSLLAPNFNAIPLADIEHIDILQGSEGSLWGNQAVGGVVLITTRHPKKMMMDALLSVGSFNTESFNLLGGNQFKNGFFFKAFGVLGKTQNYRAHNQQTANNIAVQTGMDYSKGTTAISLQSYNNTLNLPGGLTASQYHHNPRQATHFINSSHSHTQILQFLNKQALSNNWIVETRLSQNDTTGDGFVFAPFYRNDSINSISPRFIGTIYRSKVTFGYDGQVSRYALSQRQVRTHVSTIQHNLYVQTIIPLSSLVDLTLGGRAAMQENAVDTKANQTVDSQDHVFVSEQGITFHPKQTLSFFLRRDGNFSFPKSNEQSVIPIDQKTLEAQTGTSYEIGSEWLSERQRTQINLYRLAIKNEIAFNPAQTALQPFGAYNNLDRTLRYGATLTESYHVNTSLSLDSQVNYVNARFDAGVYTGNVIPAVPAWTGNVGVNYALTSRWQIKYSWLYTGSRFASNDVDNVGQAVSPYWLGDMAIQYQIKPVRFNFDVTNLFNQIYAAYTYYNPDNKTNTYYPGMGRSFMLTVKVDVD